MVTALIKNLHFRLRAKHLHGIHSPFVFNLLETAFKNTNTEESLYALFSSLLSAQRQSRIKKKRTRLLTNIAWQLSGNHIAIISNHNNDYVTQKHNMRYMIMPINDVLNKSVEVLLHSIKCYDVIFIIDLRFNDKVFSLWKELYSLPQVSLALDFYNDGVLFLNRPMEKQYFKIRI